MINGNKELADKLKELKEKYSSVEKLEEILGDEITKIETISIKNVEIKGLVFSFAVRGFEDYLFRPHTLRIEITRVKTPFIDKPRVYFVLTDGKTSLWMGIQHIPVNGCGVEEIIEILEG